MFISVIHLERCCICFEKEANSTSEEQKCLSNDQWVKRHVSFQHPNVGLCQACAFKWKQSCPVCRAEPEVLRAEITQYVKGLSLIEVTDVVSSLNLEALIALYNGQEQPGNC